SVLHVSRHIKVSNTSLAPLPLVYAARRGRTGRTLPSASYTSSHLRLVSSFARSPSPSDIASAASARAACRLLERATRNTCRTCDAESTAARPDVPGGRPRRLAMTIRRGGARVTGSTAGPEGLSGRAARRLGRAGGLDRARQQL